MVLIRFGGPTESIQGDEQTVCGSGYYCKVCLFERVLLTVMSLLSKRRRGSRRRGTKGSIYIRIYECAVCPSPPDCIRNPDRSRWQ
jgi:hypothetical protein